VVAAIEQAGVCERKCGRFRFCLLFGLVTGSHGVLVVVSSFVGLIYLYLTSGP
jgi:hypothetical protein